MNRRRFLESAAIGGGVVAVAGGLLVRRSYAREQLRQRLMTAALPVLTAKAHGEFQSVPAKGREEIRQWFHGKALNVASFVDEICSNAYREKLHSLGAEDQHRLLLVSFCGKVATADEIRTRVQTITEELVAELNLDWGECCKTVSSQWNLHIREYGRLQLTEFMDRVDTIVKQHLNESLEMARSGVEYPAFVETIGNIGEAALLVLPVATIKCDPRNGGVEFNPLAIPTFVLLSLKHLFDYIVGLFSDPRSDLQRAISAQVSLIGNRIGSEFESEVRTRLGALHGWQEQSLSDVAQQYANAAVGWLS